MTGPRQGALVALVAVLLSLPVATPALGRPDLVGALGAATLVEGGKGDSEANLSVSLSLLWPFEEHHRFGVMAFTDDLGDHIGRLRDSQGQDLGPVSALHRNSWGFGWRAEAHRPTTGRYDVFLLGSWAYYRMEEDVRGATIRRNNATGIGFGLGASRALAPAHTVGLTLTYRQIWRGLTQRYLTAAAEWRWRGTGQ